MKYVLVISGITLVIAGLLVNLPLGNYSWLVYDFVMGGVAIFAGVTLLRAK